MRSNGHTFRNLLKALLWASEGKRVVYVSSLHRTAESYCAAAKSMASMYLTEDFLSGTKTQIKMKNGGSIKFLVDCTEKSPLPGYDQILWDY